MDQIEIREGAKRQHRSLGMFCTLYCWQHNKKALFIEEKTFLTYLGLERFRDTRFEWIKEDFQPYFSYCFKIEENGKKFIFFSKVSEEDLQNDKDLRIYFNPKIFELFNYKQETYKSILSDDFADKQKVIEAIDDLMPHISAVKNFHEVSILNALFLLSNGIASPEEIMAISKT